MKMKLIAAAALVVAFAMPAFAANEYYLVQDTATKKCSIVETEPTVGTMKVVGAVHEDEGGSRNCDESRQELRRRVVDSVRLPQPAALSVSDFSLWSGQCGGMLPSQSLDQSN